MASIRKIKKTYKKSGRVVKGETVKRVPMGSRGGHAIVSKKASGTKRRR